MYQGVKKWIHLLPSYYHNFSKRLVKTPKVYFLDTALAAYLTRQPSQEAAWRGAMGEAFFEGWIITDLRKQLISEGIEPNIYFWKSRDGVEVDLILEMNTHIIPIEIKQTSTPTGGHAKGLQKFCQFTNSQSHPGILACNIPEKKQLPYGIRAIPWWELKTRIFEILNGWLFIYQKASTENKYSIRYENMKKPRPYNQGFFAVTQDEGEVRDQVLNRYWNLM